MLENVYEGLNARPKVYLSKEYFCEMYPTCMSSKLYEFISSCRAGDFPWHVWTDIFLFTEKLSYYISIKTISNWYQICIKWIINQYISQRKIDWSSSEKQRRWVPTNISKFVADFLTYIFGFLSDPGVPGPIYGSSCL